ncbi:acyl-CoA N-acyltransferase [Mycena alexandri]|uniref:Acyl-CoA N-acyltransferase n=1 Tax=Mycena alexandri TaxID=1745969 RepID=A0AAD6S1W8_9AGAR|nr:acyl-CoA N-acyltransferase [Mycena alexandri]
MILDGAITSRSGRIALVPPSETNDAATAALREHSETRRYLRYFPEHVSVDDAPDVRTFVGTTGIFHVETEYGSSCEVGILISPEYFRGGLATDALYTVLAYVFEERKLNRAEFNTGVDNLGMRRWLEKAGATLEGTQRQKWLDPGVGYTDVCKYSILHEEWIATVKGRLEARIDRSLQSSDGV